MHLLINFEKFPSRFDLISTTFVESGTNKRLVIAAPLGIIIFFASENWEDIVLPFKNFSRSSRWLNRILEPSMVRSLGIVAYGRDHQADIQVSKVEGY